ncbi:MAG: hypothetical protein ACRED9_06145 [Caulobacteraceae bacterium]
MKLVTPLLFSALILGACSETPYALGPAGRPPPSYNPGPPAPFEAQDFAWSTQNGGASIDGVLAFRAQGLAYQCAGGDVILTPETRWSRRRMIILYGSATSAEIPVSVVRAREPTGPAADYARYVRRATCDDANRFHFRGLPAGRWFVITVAKPVGGGEGVAVMRRVVTGDGPRFVTLG